MTPNQLRTVSIRKARHAVIEARRYAHYATDLDTGKPTNCRPSVFRELNAAAEARLAYSAATRTWAR